MRERDGFVRRATIGSAVAVTVVALVLVVVAAYQVVMLLFSALLLAVLLDGMARPLRARTRLSRRPAIAIAATVLVVVLGGVGWLLAPSIATQGEVLARQLPESIQALQERLIGSGWGRALLSWAGRFDAAWVEDRATWQRLAGVFSTIAGAIGGTVVLLFLGLYLALEPRTYMHGLLRLVPPARRPRLEAVLREVAHTLGWWLLGKLVSMTVVAVLTTVGLALMGVPLALAFGVLAFFLNFIPNLGPVLSAVPPILMTVVADPVQALWVALLYLGIQIVETYGITPFIERRTVELPPATIIAFQVLLGTLVGGIGVVLATPLTAAGIVLVRRLYVEDVLERRRGDRAV